MGMSTHVIGFAPPDDDWKKHKQVWDACVAAGVHVPDETQKFFGFDEPDDGGVEVSESDLAKAGALREWSDDMRSGYELVIAKLPAHLKTVRFYNSW